MHARACLLALVLSCLAACASTAHRELAPADAGPLKDIRAQLRSDDEPFTLVVRFTIKDTPEAEAAFVRLASAANTGTSAEPGARAYRFNRGTANPREIVLYEEWRSFTDLRRHFAFDYVGEFLAAMPGLVESGPDVAIYRRMHAVAK